MPKSKTFKKQGTDILSATLSHKPERNMPQKTILPLQKAQNSFGTHFASYTADGANKQAPAKVE